MCLIKRDEWQSPDISEIVRRNVQIVLKRWNNKCHYRTKSLRHYTVTWGRICIVYNCTAKMKKIVMTLLLGTKLSSQIIYKEPKSAEGWKLVICLNSSNSGLGKMETKARMMSCSHTKSAMMITEKHNAAYRGAHNQICHGKVYFLNETDISHTLALWLLKGNIKYQTHGHVGCERTRVWIPLRNQLSLHLFSGQ